jgi:hypothetical protein
MAQDRYPTDQRYHRIVPFSDDTESQNTRSNIHHCLRKRLTTGQIKLSPFFECLMDGATDSLEEYKALWQLVSLAAKPLHKYIPKMGHTYQQRCIAMAISLYSHPIMPVGVWWSADRPVHMSKLRSLALLIHVGAYKTAKSYAGLTRT